MKIKNSYYEGLLQDLFCGNDGFFTIFMHFLYQYNQIFVFYPKFEKEFEKLFQTEIEICNILSKIIIEMGGDAKYYSSTKKFLNGNIDYIDCELIGYRQFNNLLNDLKVIGKESKTIKIKTIEKGDGN